MSVEFKENSLLAAIEEAFRSKAPDWKLQKAMYSDDTRIYSEWQSTRSKVVVQIIMMPSPEAASAHLNLFDRKIALDRTDMEQLQNDPARFQLAPAIQADTKLEDLGDENHVWTEFGEGRVTLIKFRTGKAVVQVTGPSVDISARFARLLAEHFLARGIASTNTT